MTKVTVHCLECKEPFLARQADINRGWGKFCSKSCKAVRQTRKMSRIQRGFDKLERW